MVCIFPCGTCELALILLYKHDCYKPEMFVISSNHPITVQLNVVRNPFVINYPLYYLFVVL